jgi:ectoine hydroxylase-related dioxygenase (phytanoyl-CoA dioxygenase family)
MTQTADPGYAVHPHVLDGAAIQLILDALGQADLNRTKAGARHVLAVPAVRALAANPRLLDLAARFVGPSPIAFRATLFDKSPSANWLVAWHQDTALPLKRRVEDPAWGPWSVKAGVLYAHAPAVVLESVVALRVSLDDSTSTNGPLRVLPDSHRYGVLTDQAIARLAAEIPPVECFTPSGGVVAMRPLTVHASSKAADDRQRRVLHIEYARSARFEDADLAVE